jgi:hypothetical protein
LTEEKERERITDDETIKLRRIGSSHGYIIPAGWLKSFQTLKREPKILIVHLEKDPSGNLFIIAKKFRTSPNELNHGGEQ